MGSPKLLDAPLGCLLHALAYFVNLRPRHIVELAVVPDELQVAEDLLISGISARHQLLFHGKQIHGILDNLRVVEQLHVFPGNRFSESIRVAVILN